jgi:redox-sensitive bicupin YhaK (pirin superfamily)
VTIVRKGFVDHSDSLGATARFGEGDVQWLTAGRGILHAEMFPLLDDQGPNPLELFQIWLNLPKADKFVDPHFSMLWSGAVPSRRVVDEGGRATTITVVAGRLGDVVPPPPPPHSWAARPEADVAIWTIAMAPGARFELPPALANTNRTLYFFRGSSLIAHDRTIQGRTAISVRADAEVALTNGPEASEILLLQGRAMGEPVVQYGPFVMNSRAEIEQAIADYRRTSFGGWPWPNHAPVHARDAGRFAKHADGRVEQGR